MEALTSKVNLADDVQLSEISDMCEHFTGADFKALLYNAQLNSIHELTDTIRGKRVSSCSSDSSQDSNAKFEMVENANMIPDSTDANLTPGGSADNSFSHVSADGSTGSDEGRVTVVAIEKPKKTSEKVVLIAGLEEGVVQLEPVTQEKLVKQVCMKYNIFC